MTARRQSFPMFLFCLPMAVLLLAAPVAAQQPGLPGTAPQVPASQDEPEPVPVEGVPQVPGQPEEEAPAEAPLVVPGLPDPASVAPARPRRAMDDMRYAVLQGLDKITARTSTFEVPVGGQGRFMLMDVTVRACRKTPPIETPEAAAFLELEESRPDEEPVRLFSGWMFASSPALSALEHPVYDVWVIDCRNEPTKAASSAPAAE